MEDKDFYLIVYDISNDRRRNKLHTALLDFGTPVQYSVFECLISKANEKRMKQAIHSIIKQKVDEVRIYPVCERCLRKVEITAGVDVLRKTPAVIVVG